MPPKFNRRRALFVLGKIDEILAWEQTEGSRTGYPICRNGALSMRSAGGTVLAGGQREVLRRVPGKTISGVAKKSVLPDVDS